MTSGSLIDRPADVDREMIKDLLAMSPAQWDLVNADHRFRRRLADSCDRQVELAYGAGDRRALAAVHDALALVYDQDFQVTALDRVECESQPVLREVAARFERAMLDAEVALAPAAVLAGWPTTGKEYVHWLKAMIAHHEGNRHRLYQSYLRDHATAADFRFFMAQETSLDPRFDDILALLQVGVSGVEKLEIAANYWDELGNGTAADVHTAMFAKTLESLGLDESYIADNILLDARISGNLSAALALSRRHHYKAVGFFAVTEYLVPHRFKCLTEGWRRLGLPEPGIRYHELHIGIDAAHASGWFKNVVAPLIDRDPRIGREIAIGASMRMTSSQRYLDALLAHFDNANP